MKNLRKIKLLRCLGIIYVLTLSLSIKILAQEAQIRTGFGYYDPRIGGETGNLFYTDVSLKLPTQLFVGIGFGLSDVYTSYRGNEVPLFEGFRSIRNYYHFRVIAHREFVLGSKQDHIIRVGPGLTYIQLRYAEPIVLLDQTTNELLVGIDESDRDQDDAGMIFSTDYSYRFTKFEIGLHLEAQLLFDVGLGGLIIAPQIGFDL